MSAAPPLPPRQEQILRKLARSFTRSGRFSESMDRDDYFQVGYLAAWSWSVKLGRGLTNLEVWIAAKHAVLDAEKSLKYDERKHERFAAEPIRKRCHGAPSLDRLDFEAALDVMTSEERGVVVGRYWRGMSDAEIAAETGLKLNRVRHCGARGVRKARALLLRSYFEDHGRAVARKYGTRTYGPYPRSPSRVQQEATAA